MEKFFITTPIYYANGAPHIGHAYTTALADVLARFHELAGENVFFLTGTDEHGQKVADAAALAGVSPKTHCDGMVARFMHLWQMLDIRYSRFIRTTDEDHKIIVRKALQSLWEKGDIYKAEYEGWYCTPDERFWTEKDIIDGKCPDCGRPVAQITEANYFFRMSAYQQWLIDYIEQNPDFIQPSYRRNEILGFLRKPLNDLCISRPKKRLSWGIELPFDNDYVTYVWFDALINYITAIGAYTDQSSSATDFDARWKNAVHLIGKDILTTHAVYWPTMLRAMGFAMPKTIFAHGWWLVDEKKMGKSLGNAVDPQALVEALGADRMRYFLMREMVLGHDASYSLAALVQRLNNDLANDLGNMLSRVTNMIHSYFAGVLPACDTIRHEESRKLIEQTEKLHERVFENVHQLKLHAALEEVNAAIRAANAYIENTQPWKLAKSGETELLAEVLYVSAQLLAKVGILFSPVIPQKARAILDSLGYAGKIDTYAASTANILPVGSKITKPEALFPRLELADLEKALGFGKTETTDKNPKPQSHQGEAPEGTIITIDDFAKVKLVVGTITTAERAPKSDKLLLLKVNIGCETREVVAGIAKWYSPEELLGKTIILVRNLQPATIRGFKSEGMLLAADNGDTVSVLTLDRPLPAGSSIR